MSDWQPARIYPAHNFTGNMGEGELQKLKSLVLRVRPTELIDPTYKPYCDATKFYEVHPDDVQRVWGFEPAPGQDLVCEHEILTD